MSIGKMLERADVVAHDSTGKPIPQDKVDHPCAGCGVSRWTCERGGGRARALNAEGDRRCCADCYHREVMRAKGTPSGAAPTPGDDVEIDQEWAQAWQQLTRDQREAWRLRHRPRPEERPQTTRIHTIAARELERYLEAGWTMVEMVEGERWKVEKVFAEDLTYDVIGERMGVSGSEARRLVIAADKVLPRRRSRS